MTVEEYLAGLPEERRTALAAVRDVIRRNLPEGYEEGIQFGMIAYYVPLSLCPKTYNGHPLQYAALAAQKNYMSVYLMSVYGDPAIAAWFQEGYRQTGKKLDMGKSCVRFKKLEDLALDLVGEAVARVPVDEYIRRYEATRK